VLRQPESGPRFSSRGVLVDEAADERAASDGGDRRWSGQRLCGGTLRCSKLKTAMRTMPVVVGHVVGQDGLEVPATDDQEVVGDFSPEAPTHHSAIEFATGVR
jgi:hypothetical protein